MRILGELAGGAIDALANGAKNGISNGNGIKNGIDDVVDAGVLAALKDADAGKALLPAQRFDLPRKSKSGPKIKSAKKQQEAQEYFERNARARFEGQRPTEMFIDDEGKAFRTDLKGRRKDGTVAITWRNQENKTQQNSQIDKKRLAAIREIPRSDRDFYVDRSDYKTDAHHIAELDRTARLFKGLDEPSKIALLKFLQKRGIEPGHTNKNRAEMSKAMHKAFHSWFDKTYGSRRLNISSLSLKERLPYIKEFINQYQAANEQMFAMRQQELRIRKP